MRIAPNAATLLLSCLGVIAASSAGAGSNAATFYLGRVSSVPAWHNLFTDPTGVTFVDSYLAAAALSHTFAQYHGNDLTFEGEGQLAYNFGAQSDWELNLSAGPRWRRFPWSHSLETSVAFLLGLSRASEVPEVEIELEGESAKLLAYWALEVTLGPPHRNWAASFRLHHRSGAFGLVADEGGMNALALGVRYAF